MNFQADRDWIVEQARHLGFDLCGVVGAGVFPELEKFEDWLGRGFHGEMKYLEDARRRDPALVMDPLRSIIVCALNYNTDQPYSTGAQRDEVWRDGPARGWVSRYAWGDDYHEVMWERLNALEAAMRERFAQPFLARAYADTGPVAERVLAKHAGLGWIGKNTLLLNREIGSWFFLGVILTSLELGLESGLEAPPAPADLCGSCTKCLDACPTGALVEARVMDARRCISYLTIELRGSIPEEFRVAMGWQVYGCDICQDVCPYNRQAPVTELNAFQPRQFQPPGVDGRRDEAEESLFLPKLEWLAGLTEDEFRECFRGSAMKRAKWRGLVRNVCIGLGNAGLQRGKADHEGAITALERLMKSTDWLIAESARWAVGRITGKLGG